MIRGGSAARKRKIARSAGWRNGRGQARIVGWRERPAAAARQNRARTNGETSMANMPSAMSLSPKRRMPKMVALRMMPIPLVHR